MKEATAFRDYLKTIPQSLLDKHRLGFFALRKTANSRHLFLVYCDAMAALDLENERRKKTP